MCLDIGFIAVLREVKIGIFPSFCYPSYTIGLMNQVGCSLLLARQRFAAIGQDRGLAWERLRFLRLHYRDLDLLAIFTFLVSVPLLALTVLFTHTFS